MIIYLKFSNHLILNSVGQDKLRKTEFVLLFLKSD